MGRPLLNLLTALSLLLCVAVCVLWVRSYWYIDIVTYARTLGREVTHWEAVSSKGRLHLSHANYQ